jgi:hypothetical protein
MRIQLLNLTRHRFSFTAAARVLTYSGVDARWPAGCGRRDLKGASLARGSGMTMVGGVLHPRQAATYTRGRSMTTDNCLGSGSRGFSSGLTIFFIIENYFFVSADISIRNQICLISGYHRFRSGLMIFLLLKINFLCWLR